MNSESLQDLLFYYNKLIVIYLIILIIILIYIRNSPIINRWKIKEILEKTFKISLISFNNSLELNIKTNGKFSVVFDIWTSNNNTAYLGIIICFIDSEFNLIYKLIGFDILSESHTGIYIFNEFKNSLNLYPTLTLNNIQRYVIF